MLVDNRYMTQEKYDEYRTLIKSHNTYMEEGDDDFIPGLHPFIDYVYEDKSKYLSASLKYEDKDGDFLLGDSEGILLNIDFTFINTKLFSATAIQYEKNIKLGYKGKEAYAGCKEGTDEYKAFWLRETERRKYGMTAPCRKTKSGHITNLHITGDHYNYLNYGRIQRVPNKYEYDEAKRKGLVKGGKIEGFPTFWDGDYWNFKLDEFIANNGFHLAKAKARRKGFSFKRGSQSANTLNLYKNITVIFAAYDLGFLIEDGGTTYMAKKNITWYEDNTHWRRGLVGENIENIQLGYKKRKEGTKVYGWQSKLLSVGCRVNTSAAVGKDAIEIDFEESGAFPNLQEVTGVTMSSTEAGALQSGTMRWYGTAGTKGANWAAFSSIFYKPKKNKALPLENVWDKNARMNTCGFFFPQIWGYEPFIDIHGNSLIIKAFKYDAYDKLVNGEEEEDLEKHLLYVGQRANSPEEAFTAGRDNIFTSADLQAHMQDVKVNTDYKFYRDGQVISDGDRGIVFKTNAEFIQDGNKDLVHSFIEDVPFNPKKDIQGCIREYHRPFKINGVVPDNLYAIVYDPVGKDKSLKEINTKNSLNAIYVLMLPNTIANSTGDIIVASYIGRRGTMEEVDRICYYLCLYYNAKALVEVDRGETVKNFRIWKALKWLYKDPRSTIDGKDNNNAGYGMVIGNSTEAENALIYLKDFIYEPSSRREDNSLIKNIHYIYDYPLLKEFSLFYKLGNFDRISALRLYPYVRSWHLIMNRKSKDKSNVKEDKKGLLYELYG